MAMYRVYPDADGITHIEPMSLEDHAYLEAIDNIKEAGIHHYPELRTMDFHPIPERRLIIHIEGDVEIGMSDGTMHVFHPGDVRLMEDDHGIGHTHRDLSVGTAFVIMLKD